MTTVILTNEHGETSLKHRLIMGNKKGDKQRKCLEKVKDKKNSATVFSFTVTVKISDQL